MRKILSALESFWRHAIVYPILRRILHNPPINYPIELSSINKILIFRHDRIGDMIVTTPILKYLKTHFPNISIGILASEKNVEIIQYNPYVNDIYVLSRRRIKSLNELLRARKKNYDVILNLVFNRTTSCGLLAYFIAPHAIKVGQGLEKYRFYFNIFLKLHRNEKHMTQTIAEFVEKVFGVSIPDSELEFEIPFDHETESRVLEFLNSRFSFIKDYNRFHCILVNLSAVDFARRISTSQARFIIDRLYECNFPCIVLKDPCDREMEKIALACQKKNLCTIFPSAGAASLLEIAALIKHVSGVITPDTSIVHFASAMKTPVLAFYTPTQEWKEWQPWKVPFISVVASDNQSVSTIPDSTIKERLNDFITTITKEINK
jgi:ADP-heptose:LPS heptosyltransferase